MATDLRAKGTLLSALRKHHWWPLFLTWTEEGSKNDLVCIVTSDRWVILQKLRSHDYRKQVPRCGEICTREKPLCLQMKASRPLVGFGD